MLIPFLEANKRSLVAIEWALFGDAVHWGLNTALDRVQLWGYIDSQEHLYVLASAYTREQEANQMVVWMSWDKRCLCVCALNMSSWCSLKSLYEKFSVTPVLKPQRPRLSYF